MLKIFVSSLNPQPPPSPVRIFNVHPLDFLNANFHVPEGYCCAASGLQYDGLSTDFAFSVILNLIQNLVFKSIDRKGEGINLMGSPVAGGEVLCLTRKVCIMFSTFA